MKKHAVLFTFGFVAVVGSFTPATTFAAGKRNACEILFDEGSLTPGKSALDSVQKVNLSDFWAHSIQALKTANPESSLGADRIESWVVAHFFFDRMAIAGTTSREYSDLVHLWDQENTTSPFLPFRKTFDKSIELAKSPGAVSKEPLTIQSIADLHYSMMQGAPEVQDVKNGDISWFDLIKARALFQWKNVEGIKNSEIGRTRSTSVGFILEVKGKNKTPTFTNPMLHPVRRTLTDQTGARITRDWVLYASLEGVDRYINDLSPKVRKAVETARANKELNDSNKVLTSMVVNDLLDSAIRSHASESASAKSLEARVEAHARFVWRFIGIHPFTNGNGRTARALLGRLLMSEGLLPPLLKNQNDVTISSASYIEQVKEGIVLSSKFIDDLVWRAQNGWEPARSPIALLSRLPKRIYFDSKQDEIGEQYAEVDVYDFAQFLRMNERGNAVKDETEMLRAYVAHLKRWTAYRAKTGEEYQVRFVPSEMQRAALQIDATNRLKWMMKKHLFYESDLAWRGLSTTTEKTLEQLLEIFVKPSDILLSMNSSNAQGPDALAASVQADFDAYNKSILDPKAYFQMSSDHMKAEGNYGRSPLLSAAMTRAVADRFSKGFLTGEQNILKQKGQLVVAAMTPEFGTSYFNRLGPISKRLDLGFISKYPRQMEIAIAGVMAPDSVMRVEYRDVKVLNVVENTGENIAGDTEVKSITLLERNPDEPSIIKVTVSSAEGAVKSMRQFQIVSLDGHLTFREIK